MAAQIEQDDIGEDDFPYYFSENSSQRLMGLIKSHHFLTVILVDLTKLSLFEDEDFTIKYCAYRAAFPALHEHLKRINKIKDPAPLIIQGSKTDPAETTIKSVTDPKVLKIRQDLMADAFAAMRMESIGGKGAIQQAVKRLCRLAVDKEDTLLSRRPPSPTGNGRP